MQFARVSRFLSVLCFFLAAGVSAQTLHVLQNFNGTNGRNPERMALVQGTDGYLYGTTVVGGAYKLGSVFRISTGGALTTLYSFCPQTGCLDGSGPVGTLVQGPDGQFYGSTQSGGANNQGTIFKVSTAGVFTPIYTFCSKAQCADGGGGTGGMVLGSDGNFYGATTLGGNICYAGGGCGTFFQLTPAGVLTTLYRFCSQLNCSDGTYPYGGIVQASDGSFYGTTYESGSSSHTPGGTVFKITSTGVLTTLYTFCTQLNCPDGNGPQGTLVQGKDGNFYGTTADGGTSGLGTVFKISPSGQLTTLHSFSGIPTEGSTPTAGLLQGNDGNFYGTTYTGDGSGVTCKSSTGCGTIFQITPAGALKTLVNFNGTNGWGIWNGLAQSTNGIFYGTAYMGGTKGFGTIFSLPMSLGRFVEFQPAFGAVGTPVTILGTNIGTATAVSFNGTPATFSVVSNSEITTTVPAGATSGIVTVRVPGLTIKSNVAFQVTP